MIKIKILNDIKKLHLKIFGSFPKIVLSNNQEKEAIPTKETQEIVPDKEYDGLSKVIIKPIPDEYIIPNGELEVIQNGTYDVIDKASVNVDVQPNLQIKSATPTTSSQNIMADEEYDGLLSVSISPVDSSIDSNIVASNIKNGVQILGVTGTLNEGITPSGELAITENGIYDVTNYASANVTVPEKQLGTKTITSNGIYKAIDDNLDGYSEVNVATSGVDINDYFKAETIDTNDITVGCWHKFIKKIPKLNLNITNTCAKIFHNCKAQEIDVSEFDTSNVLNMQYMFRECSSLTSLDVSNFNTANVTTMEGMFWNCSSLTNLDLSSFNTARVTIMRYMFAGCSSLTSIDLSSFDTSNVTNMQSIFAGCFKLTSLDISNFNTSKVTNMQFMFSVCSSLTSLDLSGFNTSKVTNMGYMFRDCTGLTSLDLSNFNTSKVTNMSFMFYNCSKLKNLNISNFDFTNVTSYSNMFEGIPSDCYILVKDATAKEWITSKFPKMTNVHYVGEEG